MSKDYISLYKRINYSFKDQAFAIRALTHRSKGKKNYERLEFLGDSILGFLIAEVLFSMFPEQSEGKLSQIRTKLVKGYTLAQLALKLGLDEYIILGASELKGGGHKRERILEDVLEALIGAIYLDSDFETVKKCVISWYRPILENIDLDVVKIKDNKSKLQEILLQNTYELPDYTLVKTEGEDHQQIFTVKVLVKEFNLETEGVADSKKKAEQLAAGEMIRLLAEKELYEKKK
ncbi:ribonuclease III [Francisella frigiditurris]|uniref:Ribonuclease 3 n=1 Tax=Francisella frigiditurris TaxID=1542390 RepID=A0A1J0KVV9_9GAMM|nr:ribonuclease III [Francisella frigiditurris]APC97933.1 ribonuclease III [Francisella frigiditurris]